MIKFENESIEVDVLSVTENSLLNEGDSFSMRSR